MSVEKERSLSDISRQAEERYLEKTLAVVCSNVEKYGRDVGRMREEIDTILAHFHDDNPELINQLENTITMHDHMKRALERNEKARNKPYFGRIVFRDETYEKDESIYIGKGGIAEDATTPIVVDWRAPVANAYYENGLGKCSYPSPGGKQIDIDLKLKRTYEIENGELQSYFDSEVIANDDLLTKYLAKNKQAVLGEIVATIQKEQNDIIRKSPYHNVIVQGVAGSGKTTVAMHRISYILYNYAERIKPDDFYIVGSNRILLNYITGVLPDLDVYGVRQMTMEQLFVRLLYEDWDDKKYRIKSTDQSGKKGIVKGGLAWFRDLEAYCNRLEWHTILRESIYLNPRQFVEGIRDGKTGVFDETEGKAVSPKDLVLLVDGEAVERYIRQNPTVSVQSKIDMLNERLINKIKEEFLGKGVKYTEPEKKAILKAYRGRYGSNVWKRSIFDMYQDFLQKQISKGYDVDVPTTEFDVYDLAALAYLYKRIKETEVISEAHHVVIDEAQDFGMMAYSVLKFCIKDCTYTIMGDVSQNIHFGYGLNDWEELRKLYLTDAKSSFGILKKSYRNTVEISNFATNILHHGQFSIYPVEPIIRHGNPVEVMSLCDRNALIEKAAETCKAWQEKGLDTIAVICRDQESAAKAAEELGKLVEVMESDLEKAEFGNGIMVLPVEYTKGLEFDAVLLLDPTREDYPVEDGHAKLLYVAATRALHELSVLHTGNLTGLIADPVPERNMGNAEQMRKRNGPDQTPSNPHDETLRSKASTPDNKVLRNKALVLSGESQSVSLSKSTNLNEKTRKVKIKLSGNIVINTSALTHRNAIDTGTNRDVINSGTSTKMGYTESNAKQKYGATEPKTDNSRTAKLQQRTAKMHEMPQAISGNSFGDMPTTDKLRPAGHPKIDLAIRWVAKQPDGLYLQSRYGVLRLSPIGSDIIRITFAKDSQIAAGVHPQIAVQKPYPAWMYKDTAKTVDLFTDELYLQVDKATGAIRYMTRDKKLLLAERSKECRQIDASPKGNKRSWLYLDWQKGEKLYGLGPEKVMSGNLRGTARYISHGMSNSEAPELPFILSDNGYGMVMASDGPTFCCDISSYGSYIFTEVASQMDFYFIAGKRTANILSAYAYLCGQL